MSSARMLMVLVFLLSAVGPAQALIGTPCDPEKDFQDVVLLDHWKNLPHKNQEETKARCDEVNQNLGRPAWTYNPKPNTPLYECLSYGAAGIAEWWALETGRKLGTYRSYAHGGQEIGFNPRKLALRYRELAKSNPVHYAMTGIQKGNRCPITNDWVPIRPTGFARILTNTKPDQISDPIDGVTFSYQANDYPMEQE